MTAKAKPAAKASEYVVLEARPFDDGTAWIEVGHVSGSGSERSLIEKADLSPGTYKLVSVRSWKGGVRLTERTRTVAEPL